MLLYYMNNSPQYNQQTEPKQCKSEVEEIFIYQNLETGHRISVSENKQWVPCQKEALLGLFVLHSILKLAKLKYFMS